ncbi:hypothetical protein PAPYR_4654 [Paratrimastix pyriformis]|uniref:Uncharacterized protein n=1 Tax=Paratrimastix pyriformis TaxID=342808 RepID=A0ABQ8UJF4_9EUKA|nr:hypothetical protein PAPYR_4654 [Paratrimastix pyriformis]
MFFDRLPDDVLIECFRFLKVEDLERSLSRVCRRWWMLARCDSVWLPKLSSVLLPSHPAASVSSLNARGRYLQGFCRRSSTGRSPFLLPGLVILNPPCDERVTWVQNSRGIERHDLSVLLKVDGHPAMLMGSAYPTGKFWFERVSQPIKYRSTAITERLLSGFCPTHGPRTHGWHSTTPQLFEADFLRSVGSVLQSGVYSVAYTVVRPVLIEDAHVPRGGPDAPPPHPDDYLQNESRRLWDTRWNPLTPYYRYYCLPGCAANEDSPPMTESWRAVQQAYKRVAEAVQGAGELISPGSCDAFSRTRGTCQFSPVDLARLRAGTLTSGLVVPMQSTRLDTDPLPTDPALRAPEPQPWPLHAATVRQYAERIRAGAVPTVLAIGFVDTRGPVRMEIATSDEMRSDGFCSPPRNPINLPPLRGLLRAADCVVGAVLAKSPRMRGPYQPMSISFSHSCSSEGDFHRGPQPVERSAAESVLSDIEGLRTLSPNFGDRTPRQLRLRPLIRECTWLSPDAHRVLAAYFGCYPLWRTGASGSHPKLFGAHAASCPSHLCVAFASLCTASHPAPEVRSAVPHWRGPPSCPDRSIGRSPLTEIAAPSRGRLDIIGCDLPSRLRLGYVLTAGATGSTLDPVCFGVLCGDCSCVDDGPGCLPVDCRPLTPHVPVLCSLLQDPVVSQQREEAHLGLMMRLYGAKPVLVEPLAAPPALTIADLPRLGQGHAFPTQVAEDWWGMPRPEDPDSRPVEPPRHDWSFTPNPENRRRFYAAAEEAACPFAEAAVCSESQWRMPVGYSPPDDDIAPPGHDGAPLPDVLRPPVPRVMLPHPCAGILFVFPSEAALLQAMQFFGVPLRDLCCVPGGATLAECARQAAARVVPECYQEGSQEPVAPAPLARSPLSIPPPDGPVPLYPPILSLAAGAFEFKQPRNELSFHGWTFARRWRLDHEAGQTWLSYLWDEMSYLARIPPHRNAPAPCLVDYRPAPLRKLLDSHALTDAVAAALFRNAALIADEAAKRDPKVFFLRQPLQDEEIPGPPEVAVAVAGKDNAECDQEEEVPWAEGAGCDGDNDSEGDHGDHGDHGDDGAGGDDDRTEGEAGTADAVEEAGGVPGGGVATVSCSCCRKPFRPHDPLYLCRACLTRRIQLCEICHELHQQGGEWDQTHIPAAPVDDDEDDDDEGSGSDNEDEDEGKERKRPAAGFDTGRCDASHVFARMTLASPEADLYLCSARRDVDDLWGLSFRLTILTEYIHIPDIDEGLPVTMLGDGPSGRSFKMRDLHTGNLVVAKEVLCESPGAQKIVFEEARKLAHLQHPQVLQCHHIFRTDPKLDPDSAPMICLVSDYCELGNLDDVGPNLSPPDRDRCAAEFLAGLDYLLRQRPYRHLNLKPSHLLFRLGPCDGRPHLVINPTLVGATTPAHLTTTPPTTLHLMAFTEQFYAPEIATGQPTFRSEFFAAGLLLFCLYAGLTAESFDELLHPRFAWQYPEAELGDVVRARLGACSTPADVVDRICRMLTAEPGKRMYPCAAMTGRWAPPPPIDRTQSTVLLPALSNLLALGPALSPPALLAWCRQARQFPAGPPARPPEFVAGFLGLLVNETVRRNPGCTRAVLKALCHFRLLDQVAFLPALTQILEQCTRDPRSIVPPALFAALQQATAAGHPDFINHFCGCRALPALIHFLACLRPADNAKVDERAFETLAHLSGSSAANRDRLCQAGLMPVLSRLLARPPASPAALRALCETLHSMAQEAECVAAFGQAGGLGPFCRVLNAPQARGDMALGRVMLSTMAALASHPAAHSFLVQEGGLPGVLRLLEHPALLADPGAADRLYAAVVRLVAAPPLPPSRASSSASSSAASASASASSPLDPRAAQVLVDLLGNRRVCRTPALLHSVLGTLHRLMETQEANRVLVVRAGAAPLLLRLFRRQVDLTALFECLRVMLLDAEARAACARASGLDLFIKYLLKPDLLADVPLAVLFLRCFCNLCWDRTIKAAVWRYHNAMETLVGLLRDPLVTTTPDLATPLCRTLNNLAINRANLSILARLGAIEPIVGLAEQRLVTAHPLCAEGLFGALWSLSMDPRHRMAFEVAGVCGPIVYLLGHRVTANNPRVAESLLGAMKNFTTYSVLRTALLQGGIVQVLSDLRRRPAFQSRNVQCAFEIGVRALCGEDRELQGQFEAVGVRLWEDERRAEEQKMMLLAAGMMDEAAGGAAEEGDAAGGLTQPLLLGE